MKTYNYAPFPQILFKAPNWIGVIYAWVIHRVLGMRLKHKALLTDLEWGDYMKSKYVIKNRKTYLDRIYKFMLNNPELFKPNDEIHLICPLCKCMGMKTIEYKPYKVGTKGRLKFQYIENS